MSNAITHADQHAHAHHRALQHHFDTMPQQKEAAVLGMWVFLLTEILFFGGLFVAYMIYRVWYFDAFAEASRSLGLTGPIPKSFEGPLRARRTPYVFVAERAA